MNIFKLEVQIDAQSIPAHQLLLKNREILSLKTLLIAVLETMAALVADGKLSLTALSKNKKVVEFTETYLEIFLIQQPETTKDLLPGETLLELWFRQSK